MADGMWTMTDEGEFELQEPYATMLFEARIAATEAWAGALFEYLVPRCPYTGDELKEALLARTKRGENPAEIVETFVLEALSGDL